MDYAFHGDPDKVNDKLNDIASDKAYSILGPRTLDGVSYACVRTGNSFSIPDGCEVTGPEISGALLGGWFDVGKLLSSYAPELTKIEDKPTPTTETTHDPKEV